MAKYQAVYTCQDCGEQFEDDPEARRLYCDKCRLKRLDAGTAKGGRGGKGKPKKHLKEGNDA